MPPRLIKEDHEAGEDCPPEITSAAEEGRIAIAIARRPEGQRGYEIMTHANDEELRRLIEWVADEVVPMIRGHLAPKTH